MKKFLSLFLCMLILMSSLVFTSASAEQVYSGFVGKNNEIIWQITINDAGKGILKFSLKSGVTSAAIPDYTQGSNSTGIYSNAPWNKGSVGDFRKIISAVWFCDGITEIGNYAFAGMKELSFLYRTDTVFRFGEGCFKECVKLNGTSVFSNIRTSNDLIIEKEAFFFASTNSPNGLALDFFDLPSKNIKIGNMAFGGAHVSKIDFVSKTHNFNTIEIGESAFEQVQSNTSNPSVKYIHFGGSGSKNNISYNTTCQNVIIGDYAFADCEFGDMQVGGVVTKNVTIGDYAFKGSPLLSFIMDTEGTLSPTISFGEYAFKDCTKLYSFKLRPSSSFKSFTVPKGMFLNAGGARTISGSLFTFDLTGANSIEASNIFRSVAGVVYLNDIITASDIASDFVRNKNTVSIRSDIGSGAHEYAIKNGFNFIQNKNITPPSVSFSKVYSNKNQTEIILEWDKKKCYGYKIRRTNTSNGNNDTVFNVPFYTTKLVDNTAKPGVGYAYSIQSYTETSSAPPSASVYYVLLDFNANLKLSYKYTDDDKLVLSWNAIPGADRYMIKKAIRKGEGESFQDLITVDAKNTTHTIPNILYGANYRCSITPYKTYEGNNVVYFAAKETIITPIISLEKITPTVSRTINSITLNWNTVQNATGYKVFKKIGSGEWVECSTQSDTSFSERNLQNNTYYYKVCAYRDYQLGEFSDEISINPLDKTAPDLNLSLNDNSVSLKWNASYGATGYQIYRSVASGEFEVIKDNCTTTSFVDSGLKYGLKYTYKVRARQVANSQSYYSDFSSSKQTTPIISLNGTILRKENVGSNSIVLAWSPIQNADKYQILCKRDSSPDWAVLDSTTQTQHTINNLESGFYTFAVRAVKDYYFSDNISNSVSEFFIDDNGTGPVLQAKQSLNNIILSWDKIAEADKYDIFRAVGVNDLVYYTTVTENEFTDTNLDYGEKYLYRVVPFKSITGGKKYMSASNECSMLVNVNLEAPVVSLTANSDKKVTLSWNQVSNAKTYVIYRAEAGVWERVSEVSGTTFIDTDLKSDTIIEYKVSAKCNYIEGSASEVVSTFFIGTTAPKISHTVADDVLKTTITIDYPVTEVPISFLLFRRSKANGDNDWSDWELVLRTNKNTISDVPAAYGFMYSYCVKAVQSFGDSEIVSDASLDVIADYSETPKPPVKDPDKPTVEPDKPNKPIDKPTPKPVNVSVKNQSSTLNISRVSLTKVKLSWNNINGAVSYKIYQKIDKGGWTAVNVLSKNSVTISNLKRGKTYSFKVIAIGKIDNSKDSNIVSVKVLAKKSIRVTAKRKGKNKVVLSWGGVFAATKYEVYVATSKNRKFKKKTQTSKTKATIGKCSKNNTYFFFVRPYQLINGKKYYGKKSLVAIVKKSKK